MASKSGSWSNRFKVVAVIVVLWPVTIGEIVAVADAAVADSPIAQAPDGILALWASQAHLTGRCALAYVGDVPAVTHWDDQNEVVYWDGSVDSIHQPFEVILTYAADSESAGAEYAVQIGSQTVSGKTDATGGPGQWAQFNSAAVGVIRLDKAGPIRVTVKCLKKPGLGVMDLRAVVLKPAAEEDVRRRMAASHPAVVDQRQSPGLTISVDVSEVPGWEDWGLAVRSYLGKWYPVIERRLHTDGFSPPRVFGVRVISVINASHKDSAGRTIYTTAFANQYHTLVASQSWARMDNLGMMAHEMTHIIQSYPPSAFLARKDEFWPREGIADYMRYYVVEPGSRYAAFDHAKADYHNGYQDTSAFLNWIENTYGTGPSGSVIARVNDALRHGSYSVAMFKQMTGKDPDELWNEFKKTL